MSDRERIEDLKDEVRSMDSEDTAGSLDQFIIADDRAGDLPNPDQRSGTPVKVDNPTLGSVSYLKNILILRPV